MVLQLQLRLVVSELSYYRTAGSNGRIIQLEEETALMEVLACSRVSQQTNPDGLAPLNLIRFVRFHAKAPQTGHRMDDEEAPLVNSLSTVLYVVLQRKLGMLKQAMSEERERRQSLKCAAKFASKSRKADNVTVQFPRNLSMSFDLHTYLAN